MSIQSYAEFAALKEVGRIVRLALDAMANRIHPGISTGELADIGAEVVERNGARSAPALVYGFPGDVLISVRAMPWPPSSRMRGMERTTLHM